MPRSTYRVQSRAKRKKVLKATKGFRGRAKNCFRIATKKLDKSLQYAYRDRKTTKRNFRVLWIKRINIAVRSLGFSYSEFINKLNHSDLELNRKSLANIAATDEKMFESLVKSIMS